ncbi:PilZ domain-containing protein [Methylobacterium sp. SI9]|uniref:PilZ domain-containing protein n=1 Tax=Methylobacterium guangdongense TaxID=3138811 RepID=UPI00313C4B82
MPNMSMGRVQSESRARAPSPEQDPAPTCEPIAGRVLLANGDELSCTALMRSPLQGDIRVQSKVLPGEIVICALDNIGILVGKITAVSVASFSVAFMVKEGRREKIATRLKWHEAERKLANQLERAPRIVPLHRTVEVRLGERIVLGGTIRDISLSGAAIDLNGAEPPFVGSRVRVGRRFATVMRLIETGIAVQFLEPFPSHLFDDRVRP